MIKTTLNNLSAIYERLCKDTDPIQYAIRQANAAGQSAKELENDAFTCGAMKGEVCAMLRFQGGVDWMKMVAFLK
jgi:hypothetical protein